VFIKSLCDFKKSFTGLQKKLILLSINIIKKMCKICNNEYEGLRELYIKNCQNIKTIPIIEGLFTIFLTDCFNITNIPNIEGLRDLIMDNCTMVTTIPIIKGLRVLSITNCQNIRDIPNIEGLRDIHIHNCYNIINFNPRFSYTNYFYTIKEFHNMNKIKKWYKRIKFSKKLWMYAELVIIDEMNPHKENNQYLEQYIKDKVYD